MNYISELNVFYDRLELNPLPSPAIALWHALMSIANKTGWQQEFTVAVSVLALKSGLNTQAIKRARNRLEQDGYIKWRSRGGNLAAVYSIISLVVQNSVIFVPQNEPQSEPQSVPQSVPQNEPQSVPINKRKQEDLNVCIYPRRIVLFTDFWEAYPKQTGRVLTEQAYIQLLATTNGLTEELLLAAALNYAESCRIKKTQEKYIKTPERWIGDSVWTEYLPENYKKPSEAVTSKPRTEKQNNKFNAFPQRDYSQADYNSLEQRLLQRGGQGSG